MYSTRHFFLWMVVFWMVLIVYVSGDTTAQNPVKHPAIMQRALPVTQSVNPTPTEHELDNPARLMIPTINVNAAIEPVGIIADGTLGTPEQSPWTDVGWYKSGSRPGERGSAVLDGHLDRPGGLPAVFWSLHNLRVGNEVIVVTTSGKRLHFQVTRVAFYAPQNAPRQEIFGDASGSSLNLITCAGDWLPVQHQTTLRLVVYTSLSKASH